MRLYEIIQTPLSADLSYDVKFNRLKVCKKPSRSVDHENERVVAIPNQPPALTLKHLHRMKLLRRRYLKAQQKLTAFRGLMYGGNGQAEQRDLGDMQSRISRHEKLQAKLDDMAIRYVKRTV
ncbi:conserved protein of unknown function [Magnetospirillum sp. XM-1]|uniref:hypothetical protein n=1 Tax=Magnetospirillum sp. XM-1 TaxID=1663591 RepID=UPI00073DC797|nr:hypothetical protein [Magnetospirillum sp. XM-1]CUW38697.1 conserved protein of unknown function [Magnetospirillum sp. XM-1]